MSKIAIVTWRAERVTLMASPSVWKSVLKEPATPDRPRIAHPLDAVRKQVEASAGARTVQITVSPAIAQQLLNRAS